jgi:minor extracellular serine protease Vpr
VFALLAALVVATVPAGAQNTGDAVDDYLIVTLTGDGAAYDNTASTNGRFDPDSQGYARILDRMQRQHARFADQLARVAPGAEIVNEFFITANAVTVKLNGASPSAIGSISGVQRSQESTLYRPTMNESVELIFADDFWAHNAGREDAGAGVTVGVIDSGILGSHEFFDCKAVEFGGFYFSGVTGLPSQGVAPPPAPGVAFVSDHGTHVSGTVGGCVTTISDGFWTGTTLSGVAPAADLVDYNVFPGIGAGFVAFDGSAFSHDIGEAIEDAVVDGVAVINMSLSGGSIGQHDFLAEVSNGAAAAGVVVVAATGNDGPDYFTVGSPASGSEVIGVGATTNSRGMATLVNTNEPDSYDAETGDFALFDGVTSYDVFDWSGNNDGCILTGAESYTAVPARSRPRSATPRRRVQAGSSCTTTSPVRIRSRWGTMAPARSRRSRR